MKSIHLYSTPKDFKIGSNHIADLQKKDTKLPEILFLTTFPPRECGIATYSEDLILALNNKYKKSFDIKIAALELQNEKHTYNEDIYTVLETDNPQSYIQLAENVNKNKAIEIVLIQHEFGLFRGNEDDFLSFLRAINKPIIVVCHTVLPRPDENLKKNVQEIDELADAFIVMTKNSAKLLKDEYKVLKNKISVIPHGTHLVEHSNKEVLKEKYNLSGRKVISTFGLLGSGKSIETTLDALPAIIKEQPTVMFMIIGKTHPGIVRHEGEKYRDFLKEKIKELHLENNVRFVDQYLKLDALLEYLQLTDIYLFTSKDRNQAVSGTFSYALSCGCPIISTPIPHAIEVLKSKTGYIVEFENPQQLAEKVILLLGNEKLRRKIGLNGLHKIAPTAWENSAIAHANLFAKTAVRKMPLYYKIPEVNFNHFKNMTTDFAMIQFSKINQPDLATGYTLDDNARALVAMCQHYKLNKDKSDLEYIRKYFEFIKFCFQPNGKFLNYVDKNKKFTAQNSENLEDANGRGIWALGFLISKSDILPADLREDAILLMQSALAHVRDINSTRSMAFIIKGIYYSNLKNKSAENTALLVHFADKLVQMYKHEASEDWQWFEGYLTYANSTLPEAMLCAYVSTGNSTYKEIARTTFDFLLSKIYNNDRVKVISNKGWLTRGEEIDDKKVGGEQPIDVAYTILALSKFYNVFKEPQYYKKMQVAFDWFLGNNHLNEIIYNPCTGGCYDGLEETSVNLNQGAESTVSYLMARLTIEKHLRQKAKARKASQTTIVARKSKVVVPLNINTPYPSQIRA